MTPIEMLEEMNLRVEYTVTARSWLEDDEGAIVRADVTFEDMGEAEQYRKIIAQFKRPDGKPSYTEVKVAQRWVTDWSTEEDKT